MTLILFLHGASSSGKSTLTRAIRASAGRPFLHLSLDHFRDSGALDPKAYPDWAAARPAVFDGMHRAMAAFAEAGNDLIVDTSLTRRAGTHSSRRPSPPSTCCSSPC
ncbi:hypothetical protein P775_25285 [Puniceibacterium antarcticum]|uniref:Chloramphenicol phosphotransferase n=1 Tax=Puniceibacterium antarcticum TaxID=1206336 RepID=A0A2G8R410_9RHOB|nr:AAA family ATPase [Puniceibacterium antarcticum]PIL16277.1 hypothetical protein P775_25285 [Puniceibacterium antarcticum]